jgi:uncharacterized protein YdeI (YjbR/CyaY-like superfamily)
MMRNCGVSEPIFLDGPEALRAWLQANADTAAELILGLRKVERKGVAVPLSWAQTVDEALCVGWIDGVRRTVEGGYSIRLTPRRPGSTWSAVNVARVRALTDEGRMQPAGLAAFERRDPAKVAIYAYENRHRGLDPESEAVIRGDPAAWAFFSAQPPSYRNTAAYWVMSAKQPVTRDRRLARLVEDSAAGRKIGPLRRPGE